MDTAGAKILAVPVGEVGYDRVRRTQSVGSRGLD
jgi:hypothetical protein